MRGGTRPSQPFQLRFGISIHPPHAGWDSASGPSSCSCVSFQSTHPMRGGTLNSRCISSMRKNFNPPTPCGVGHGHAGRRPVHDHISIHPPHAGWDFFEAYAIRHAEKFQSTHPMRGGTPFAHTTFLHGRNFNPPTPCGVGPFSSISSRSMPEFQSTHPMRGGTKFCHTQQKYSIYFNPPTPCGVGLRRVIS